MVRLRIIAAAIALASCLAGCFGRVERGAASRTLPFHAHESELADYPRGSIEPVAPVSVAANVVYHPFVAYYPLPVGFFAKDAAYNGSTAWAPFQLEPGAEVALLRWLQKTVVSGQGPERHVYGVVTDFQWYLLGFTLSAGRIATQLVVTDENGKVLYAKTKSTKARLPFVDALFRVHLREWLSDKDFLAAMQGGRA